MNFQVDLSTHMYMYSLYTHISHIQRVTIVCSVDHTVYLQRRVHMNMVCYLCTLLSKVLTALPA